MKRLKKDLRLITDQDLASRVLRRGAGLASSPRSAAGNRHSRSFVNSSYFAREQATDRWRNGIADAGCELLVDCPAAGGRKPARATTAIVAIYALLLLTGPFHLYNRTN